MCLNPKSMLKVSYVLEQSGELVTRLIYPFNLERVQSKFPNLNFEEVKVSCGKCVECLSNKSKEWAFRMMSEAKMHKESCFLTLTYKDNPVSLRPRDLTLFLKRLRKSIEPVKIRYFACGEYGSKGKRPHYHLIVFGWRPSDLEYFFKSGNNIIYKSVSLSRLWSFGFVSVGDLSIQSCKYCAKYLQKLNKTSPGLVSPFVRMSLKPGIGLEYFKQNSESFLEQDKLIVSGEFVKLPRYFIEYSRRTYYFNQDDLKERRILKAKFLRVDKLKIARIKALFNT